MSFSMRNSAPILPTRSPVRPATSHEAELEGRRMRLAQSMVRFRMLSRRDSWSGSVILSEVITGCFYALVVGIVFLVAYATLAVEVGTQNPQSFALVDGPVDVDVDSDCDFQEGRIYGVVVDNPAAFIDSAKDHVLYFDRQHQKQPQLQLRRSWGGGDAGLEKPLMPFHGSRVKVCRMKLMPEREVLEGGEYAGVQFMWTPE